VERQETVGGTVMKQEEFEKLELEKLYGELRDKMNTRLPTWSLLITLFGAFSYASVQPGIAGYIVLCYPLLACCVARFVGHSENAVDKIKCRIYEMEHKSDYMGFERSNAEKSSKKGSGGHKVALRDFVLLTDAMAIIALVARLALSHLPWLAFIALVLEALAVWATWVFLQDEPAHQEEQKRITSALRNAEKEAVTQ
jgi:hypothetical protein